jgi:hypothetical protein
VENSLKIKDEITKDALIKAIDMYTHWLNEANLSNDGKEETEGYTEALTDVLNQLEQSRIEKHHCSYCGKELFGGEDCYHCADTSEIFCYEEINCKEDIDKTCIGKDLLECGYSKDKIYFMIGKDYNEYSKAIEEGTLDELEDENGDSYPEIFYTTVEE